MTNRKINKSLAIKEPIAAHYPQTVSENNRLPPANASPLNKIELLFASIKTVHFVDIFKADEVTEYLLRFPELITIVSPMCAQLRTKFGRTAQIILQMYFDPEIDHHYLTICLRLDDYHTDFMEQIELIHEAFDDQMTSVSGRLLITTDFISPRR